MIDDGDRESCTGTHHAVSGRMALALQAERIADILERRTGSTIPPPSEDDLANAETIDVEPDHDPAPIH